MRDLKIGIKSMEESAKETEKIFRQFDQGIFPEQPIERVYFHDFKTLLRYITPKRPMICQHEFFGMCAGETGPVEDVMERLRGGHHDL